MSNTEKNVLIAMLMVASAYFYGLAYTQADLVQDAVQLCVFEEPTLASISQHPGL